MLHLIQQDDHDHTNVVLNWGFDSNNEWVPNLFGCSKCDVVPQATRFEDRSVKVSHKNCKKNPCFGCRAKTIQMSTGDAGRAENMAAKKWDKELSDYRDARKQGIQPAGTSQKQIQEAVEASQNMGKAFNAETMGAAKKITKTKAKKMKEAGVL